MSQTAYLYQLRLPAANWVAAVEGVHRISRLDYLYAEEPADIHLGRYRPPAPDWPEGRAFGNEAEVRWSRRPDGQVELTLLVEKPFGNDDKWQPYALTSEAVVGGGLRVEDGQIMLLGVSRRHAASPYQPANTDSPMKWTDSRIPRALVYPLAEEQSTKRWVKVHIKSYCLNNRPVLTRMVGFEGVDDGETKKL